MNSLPLLETTASLNGPTGPFCLYRHAAHHLGHPVAVKLRIIPNGGGQKFGIEHPGFGFNHLNPVPTANRLRVRRGQNFGPQRHLQKFQAGNIGAQIGQFVGRAKTVHEGSRQVVAVLGLIAHR